MIISWILSIPLLFLFIYGWHLKIKTRRVGYLICIISTMGLCFIWFPDFSTYLANYVGVGRGADLVFYVFIIVSLIVVFTIYLKIENLTSAITLIVRSQAIAKPLYISIQNEKMDNQEGNILS